MSVSATRRLLPAEYTIACLCALSVELAPMEGMLDEIHENVLVHRQKNAYTLGAIGGHNIVIAVMHEMGTNAAAATATQLMNDFPEIRFGLLVGVGGGVPGDVDVRLGDVVVSQPTATFPGVVQYDMGKQLEGGQFERTGSLSKPPAVLSANVRKLDGQYRRLGCNLLTHITDMFLRYPAMRAEYSFPGVKVKDQLFISTYKHVTGPTCDQCEDSYQATRLDRANNEPKIHYGTIGSANIVVRDAKIREEIQKDIRALCIEMEAAGLMSDFPCLVIRGICDYADSHKNKEWQPFAAAAAAAYFRALLLIMPAEEVIIADHAIQKSRRVPEVYQMAQASQHDESGESISAKQLPMRRKENSSTLTLSTDHPSNRLLVGPSLTQFRGNYAHPSGKACRMESMCIGADDYDTLLKSLLFDRINFRVNNVKKPMLSTCEWLFRHPSFRAWNEGVDDSQHIGFLWIKGKPGCGKSTLMKTAVERARTLESQDCTFRIIIPYFFNARAPASLEKSSLGLYRTVVYHLLSACSLVRPLFAERFAPKIMEQSSEKWTAEELQNFLFDAIELSDIHAPFEMFLFIDALDEAEFEDDVRQMISFLTQLSDRALASDSICKLRICLSSRHYPHITIGRGRELVVEDQFEHCRDIEIYLAKELTCLDGAEKDDLRRQILEKSANVFLWVVLVVRLLNQSDDRGASIPEMVALLQIIPAGLNELFHEILTRRDRQSETSVLCFQWMVFSMRPLQPTELFVAIEYSRIADTSTESASSGQSIPNPDRLSRFILDCSRGLAEVVEAGSSQGAVVQFIHETVREFLLGRNGLASLFTPLSTNLTGSSHDTLRAACLRRVTSTNIPPEYHRFYDSNHESKASWKSFILQVRTNLPFLDYAVSHLLDHAEQAQNNGISQQAFLKNHISANGLWKDSHRRWWNTLQRSEGTKIKSDRPLIRFIIQNRLLNLIPILLDVMGTSDTIIEEMKFLLSLASIRGDTKVVQILLSTRSVVIPQKHYDVVFYRACKNGQHEVVQMLINASDSARALIDHGCNALRVASERGHARVVQTLIDAGVDVNARGEHYGSALEAAVAAPPPPAGHGVIDIIRMLIDAGADVNAEGGSHGNVLQAASKNHDIDIVETLINAGADVNARGGYYGNALQAASASGDVKTVQILINAGADVNTRGGHYGSVLQAASAHGNITTIRMLVDAGAVFNAQGEHWIAALQAAARREPCRSEVMEKH